MAGMRGESALARVDGLLQTAAPHQIIGQRHVDGGRKIRHTRKIATAVNPRSPCRSALSAARVDQPSPRSAWLCELVARRVEIVDEPLKVQSRAAPRRGAGSLGGARSPAAPLA